MNIELRPERPDDIDAIRRLTEAAFREAVHTSHTEHFIVDALRRDGDLAVSLVAVEAGDIVGHVALSPVLIEDGSRDWYGLGPVSVMPRCQRRGIGTRLMRQAMRMLDERGAAGCVVLGDPAYYGRFGFVAEPALCLPGVPAEYFQCRLLRGGLPRGVVRYADGFDSAG